MAITGLPLVSLPALPAGRRIGVGYLWSQPGEAFSRCQRVIISWGFGCIAGTVRAARARIDISVTGLPPVILPTLPPGFNAGIRYLWP